jgi:NAD(P)-dependent dehydrogenase (short-subunit alcohol dehydrogenase family)
MRLENKVALVTGGASGIGRASALVFAREGASVVVSDLNVAGSGDTVQEIVAAGGTAIAIAGDVSDTSDAKRMVESTVEAYGSIDVVLNSAGVISDTAILGDAVPEDRFERTAALYDRVLEVNLRGTYLICWLAIQQMRENGGGSIINISSINGVVGAPIGLGSGFDPYVPSKGGVVQLTKNLAIQYGRDSIRVNCICPGHVRTNLIRSITDNPQITERLEERYPLGRFAEPEEIANAALFLASDESSFVTGAPMLVDGGYTAL